MGTEILRPQDCLIGRMRDPPAAFHRRRSNYGSFNPNHSNYYNSNPRLNRKPAARPDQRKRFGSGSGSTQLEATISKRSSSDDLRTARSNLVMEKVTILRRGDSLDSKIKSSEQSLRKEGDGGLVVTGAERLGPDPETVPKQIRSVDFKIPVTGRCDVYAGSAFAVSPAPSSLPLPSFSRKKQVFVDDSATRDLRRLLRLDM